VTTDKVLYWIVCTTVLYRCTAIVFFVETHFLSNGYRTAYNSEKLCSDHSHSMTNYEYVRLKLFMTPAWGGCSTGQKKKKFPHRTVRVQYERFHDDDRCWKDSHDANNKACLGLICNDSHFPELPVHVAHDKMMIGVTFRLVAQFFYSLLHF
jgi:hypothetical protein